MHPIIETSDQAHDLLPVLPSALANPAVRTVQIDDLARQVMDNFHATFDAGVMRAPSKASGTRFAFVLEHDEHGTPIPLDAEERARAFAAQEEVLPGLTRFMLESCGILVPERGALADYTLKRAWIFAAIKHLARLGLLQALLLGRFLDEVHRTEAWRGESDSFEEFCAEFAGVDKYRASKVRTIERVLVREAGVPLGDLLAIGDETKAYQLAAHTQATLRGAGGDSAKRESVLQSARELASAAPALRRPDFRLAMLDAGMTGTAPCKSIRVTCTLTGEVDPQGGCEHCAGDVIEGRT